MSTLHLKCGTGTLISTPPNGVKQTLLDMETSLGT